MTPRRASLLLLILGFVAFTSSDGAFSFLEDETTIVTAARAPAGDTIGQFFFGGGQHEHPPLSDLLLHYWLPVAGRTPTLLRIPSVIFYLAGLFLLGIAAGEGAEFAVIALGVMWPFGFHFGRLCGWYALTFLLVAGLTLVYKRYLAGSSAGWFAGVSLLLVYCNYFGLVVVGCLLVDCLRRRHPGWRLLGSSTIGTIAVGCLPLWGAFMNQLEVGIQPGGGRSLTAQVANAAYCVYSLFVSEAVAPWIFPLSIPVSIAIAGCMWTTYAILGEGRRSYFWMFWVLVGGLALAGAIGTKRLLFIAPWLLIAIGTALTSPSGGKLRHLLRASLIVICLAGWVGTIRRDWYAAPHFVEPWEAIAKDAASIADRGATIVSNSPSFLFYINYAFAERGMLREPFLAGRIVDNRVVRIGDAIPKGEVLLVEGVNVSLQGVTEDWRRRLTAACRTTGRRELLPDSGYALKRRFFGGAGQRAFRIEIRSFYCEKPITPLVRSE